jgi:hypothetical protein
LHEEISEFAIVLRVVKIGKLTVENTQCGRSDSRRIALVDGDSNLSQLLDGQNPSLGQSLNNGVNTDTLLDIRPDLLQDLGSQKGNRSGTISNLGVLGTSDID